MKNKEIRRPLLVLLSSTRNYGWVTRAFCQANSQWADHIIIVDQMSTDDTRTICSEYKKVILIDDENLTYSENRRSIMALNKAREIPGDKILIYLAIDEILPSNWLETEDGNKILQSKPTDMFLLDWANLLPDNIHCRFTHRTDLYRIFHDDGITDYYSQNKDMHTHCLPYHFGGEECMVHDFPILHFGIYNTMFTYTKMRYYQMIDYDKNNRSIIALSRFYNLPIDNEYAPGDVAINPQWLWTEFDIFSLLDLQRPPMFVEECAKLIANQGIKKYANLDIWDSAMLKYLQVKDPRPWWTRLLHAYLHKTSKYKDFLMIRAIDKILKKMI